MGCVLRQTINDYDAVLQILSHPDVLPWISEDRTIDFARCLADAYLKTEGVYVLHPRPGAQFVCIARNVIMYEVHCHLVPETRGKAGIMAAKEAIEYMFTETPCEKLIGWTPSLYRHAMVFNRLCGFSIEGISKDAIRLNGDLCNLILWGLSNGR